MSAEAACPACGATFVALRSRWIERCRGCGLLRQVALLAPLAGLLDETAAAPALVALRQANARRSLALLQALGPRGQLLDVGCGHGWFLAAAQAAGYQAEGLEPDPRMVAAARRLGQTVIDGDFPQALDPARRYAVVAFNDVFEHLADPVAALAAARDALVPGGLLAIAAPSANGAFYRLARLLAVLRLAGPLARLWQRGWPSPHLWYFTPATLQRLITGQGLTFCARRRLPAVGWRGLGARLAMDRRTAGVGALPASRWVLAGLLALLLPVLWLLPSDSELLLFRRTGEAA